jgi:hypothetical protein
LNEKVDFILAFTKYWEQCAIKQGITLPTDYLEHGFNPQMHYPFPTHLARHYYGIKQDDFIILNLNRKINIQTNHIHGELNCPENPIIFGFGDEHDDDYKGFENKNNNELFQHIKSFNYLKTSNYQDLIRFIYASEFQVCIMGHSCGLSDRTMLKEIFEHDNCKSILIYYHKWGNDINQNDYVEKTYEISRHFTDKGTMRKKVVSFDKSKHL